MNQNRQLISKAVLQWYTQHGRKNLPWQNTQNPYRIWVSEIMLQQTQVTTVIPYYERFIKRFDTIASLAKAPQDEVLHLWTGLGYYARARNLQAAAKKIMTEHNGQFPSCFEQVLALPGIGRSTASAILAFSQGLPLAILDGNVKRVLCRFYAIEGWYGHKAVEKKLWQLAEQNTPKKHVQAYTQAIMDFGATLCKRNKPNCQQCPLQQQCQAYQQKRVNELPHPKPKADKPIKQVFMLLIKNDKGEYLLQQNPPAGIWGGLWCPPQVHKLDDVSPDLETKAPLPTFRHTFSHYHLDISPVPARFSSKAQSIGESTTQLWYNPHKPSKLGLAAPVKKLLEQHAKTIIRS